MTLLNILKSFTNILKKELMKIVTMKNRKSKMSTSGGIEKIFRNNSLNKNGCITLELYRKKNKLQNKMKFKELSPEK